MAVVVTGDAVSAVGADGAGAGAGGTGATVGSRGAAGAGTAKICCSTRCSSAKSSSITVGDAAVSSGWLSPLGGNSAGAAAVSAAVLRCGVVAGSWT